MVKESAFFGDAVEGGSLDYGVVGVGRGMRPTPVVGDAEEDVGALRSVADRGEKKEGEIFHARTQSYAQTRAILAGLS